ncbi:hypothetical protein [Photobacterium atrarenae]|uniref:hypothetical protein n=1 Tax=Photobacterium atrarenae TaxID=865757 RepID=UPI0034E296CC
MLASKALAVTHVKQAVEFRDRFCQHTGYKTSNKEKHVNPTTHGPSQCVGAMTTQEAYGHLDPNRYTIQVLALSEERDVRGYIRDIK